MGTAELFGGERSETSPLRLVTEEVQPPYTVLHVKVEVDLYTAPRLGAMLPSLVRDGKYHVIVDFEGVEVLDSTGLSVLMKSRRRFESVGGVLMVARAALSRGASS